MEADGEKGAGGESGCLLLIQEVSCPWQPYLNSASPLSIFFLTTCFFPTVLFFNSDVAVLFFFSFNLQLLFHLWTIFFPANDHETVFTPASELSSTDSATVNAVNCPIMWLCSKSGRGGI